MSEPAGRAAVWTGAASREPKGAAAPRLGSEQRAEQRQGSAQRAGARRRGGQPVHSTRSAPLRLVADGGHLVGHAGHHVADRIPGVSAERSAARQQLVRTGTAPHAAPERDVQPRVVRPRRAAHSAVRLTRRGRLAVTAAVVIAIGAVTMALAGAAQATGHSGAPAAPGTGVTKVEIRTGQSLWSVAAAYDPNADTRLVIDQIMQMNSLNSDQVQPGQVLWVPRG